MSVKTVEGAIRARIEQYLMDAFIAKRSVDPLAVAEEMVRKGVSLPVEDLSEKIRIAANGLGVRLKE